MPKARSAARRRVSQADVARLAGVSTGIVSSVINGRDYGSIRVSSATRERVQAAVRELGYIPNIAARNLARGSNRLIGVFTYESLFPLKSRNFYHQFLVGIEEAAETAEHNLLLVTGAKDAQQRRSIYAGGINQLQLADGALLLGTQEDDEEIARLAAESYPFVFVGRREFEGVELSYVAADYVQGTAAVVEEAFGLGHRRIAMIISSGRPEPLPGRRAGFAEAAARLGLAPEDATTYVIGKPGSVGDSGAVGNAVETPGPVMEIDDVIADLRRRQITAVLTESSDAGSEIRLRAEAAGLAVPADLSIVGLGGAADAPDLTELHVPRYEMGQEAVRLLLAILADPDSAPLRTTLACGLHRRDTLTQAPSAPR